MNEENKEKRPLSSFYYANGMGMKQCRQLCRFYFGVFFFEAKMDRTEQVVTIYIFNKVRDKETGKVLHLDRTIDVKYFDDYWCAPSKQWKLERMEMANAIDFKL